MNIEDVKVGELIYKEIPDFNSTLTNMEYDVWYQFSLEHHHGWYQFARAKVKQLFEVQVKRQDSKTYVRKIIPSE